MKTTYHYKGYKSSANFRFDCPKCGEKKRNRTFTVEHTLNPYNTNPDGTVKTMQEVINGAHEAAKAERDRFKKYPLCRKCEDSLNYKEILDIAEKRRKG